MKKKKKHLKYFIFLLAFLLGIYFIFFYLPSIKENDEKQKTAYKKKLEWEALVEHAQIQSYLQQYQEAESEFRKLLEMQPNSIDLKVDLASLLFYQKKYSQAMDLLKTIPEEKRNNKMTLLLANLYLSENHYSEAENLYREYLQKIPESKEASIKLAEVLSWEKKYEEAIAIYQNILAQDPQNVQIRRQYAKVLVWMGKFNEGAEELKKTLPEENPIPRLDKENRAAESTIKKDI